MWKPGRYDNESWVKYSKIGTELTKTKRAMPNDESHRTNATLTNYNDEFIIVSGGIYILGHPHMVGQGCV